MKNKFNIVVFSKTENNKQVLDLIGDDRFLNITFFDPNACEVVNTQLDEAHLIVYNLADVSVNNFPWALVLNYGKDKLSTPLFLLASSGADIREIREWKGDQKLVSVFTEYDRYEDFKIFLEMFVERLKMFLIFEQPGNYYDFNRKVPKHGPTV